MSSPEYFVKGLGQVGQPLLSMRYVSVHQDPTTASSAGQFSLYMHSMSNLHKHLDLCILLIVQGLSVIYDRNDSETEKLRLDLFSFIGAGIVVT